MFMTQIPTSLSKYYTTCTLSIIKPSIRISYQFVCFFFQDKYEQAEVKTEEQSSN